MKKVILVCFFVLSHAHADIFSPIDSSDNTCIRVRELPVVRSNTNTTGLREVAVQYCREDVCNDRTNTIASNKGCFPVFGEKAIIAKSSASDIAQYQTQAVSSSNKTLTRVTAFGAFSGYLLSLTATAIMGKASMVFIMNPLAITQLSFESEVFTKTDSILNNNPEAIDPFSVRKDLARVKLLLKQISHPEMNYRLKAENATDIYTSLKSTTKRFEETTELQTDWTRFFYL